MIKNKILTQGFFTICLQLFFQDSSLLFEVYPQKTLQSSKIFVQSYKFRTSKYSRMSIDGKLQYSLLSAENINLGEWIL